MSSAATSAEFERTHIQLASQKIKDSNVCPDVRTGLWSV